MKINCAVIDDEPLARECIIDYVHKIDFLELSGIGNNPVELTKLMEQKNIDLVFLDIQMPVLNGIDYLKVTKNPPMIIITTAYPSYALEGFQLDVLDYLVKPITFNRFFKGATKAKDYHDLLMHSSNSNTASDLQNEYFFVKCDYKFEKIFFNEIQYIEGMQNYVTIHTDNGKYVTLLNMKMIEEKLKGYPFMRVHKSYIASTQKVQSIENNDLVMDGVRIPISRNYKEEVLQQVLGGKLWKK
ncbi:LytR/AlgR family response regulator transcription factor [Flexithrix dorotheae]|uniref:LytR/AlgR family response regulator transcription factor n=1 Tax=Flexithrix dorotheae TaxID=70993 RepID=UPI00036DD3D9|nr:LytTR family DNA-binding domain-containing protein [Flexithrix dorotheae]